MNVKEGEFLLAVNGKELKAPTEVFSLFENTAGKLIEITVGPNADGKGSRTVTVEPIGNELALRNMDWIEGNLHKVEKATGGKVGYVYVPDTAGQGMAYFKRYFFPQVDKDALIIDERFNSGGQIADYYIDILRRPFASYWAPRHGSDSRSPSAAVFGPKVMIIDEGAGSGGDMLPWMFRKFKVGPARRQADLGRAGRHLGDARPDGRRKRDRAELRHLDPGAGLGGRERGRAAGLRRDDVAEGRAGREGPAAREGDRTGAGGARRRTRRRRTRGPSIPSGPGRNWSK